MKKLLLSLAFVLGLGASAQAQCIGVGGVNSVPQTGLVCQSESNVPSYHAVGQAIAVGTTPTDVACITGSASKVVRLKKVRLSGTAGTAINISVYLTKHTVANTGGTAATGTALPTASANDTAFPTAVATLQAWTVNPTIDSSAVIVNAATLFLPVTSTASGQSPLFWDWSTGAVAEAPPVIRGVAQQYCINLNGVTAPSSGLLNVEWVWTEAPQ